jgi:NhaA family Na+:H+ antiporter
VDDIVAVLVIALFYSQEIHFLSLFIGLAGLLISMGANLLGVRKPAIYALVGVFVWVAVLKSGVHATIAGVLLAFTIPARTYLNREAFVQRCRALLSRFETSRPHSFEEHASVHTLEAQCELFESPLHRVEHYLQPWVSFLIMPLFAFTNAGVRIIGKIIPAAQHPVGIGVALGLFLGKPLGIWAVALLSAKLKWAAPPVDVSWRQIFGASWICGIGFTMSLFIAGLAFTDGNLLDIAKIAILIASAAAAVCGSIFLIRESDNEVSLDQVNDASTDSTVRYSGAAH